MFSFGHNTDTFGLQPTAKQKKTCEQIAVAALFFSSSTQLSTHSFAHSVQSECMYGRLNLIVSSGYFRFEKEQQQQPYTLMQTTIILSRQNQSFSHVNA